MAKDKRRPGEGRRRKGKRKVDPSRPRFRRPIEWAIQEQIGVKAWLARLKGPEGETYPEGWRRGQIKHYEKRARMLLTEIKKVRRAEAVKANKEDTDPSVA